MNIFILLIRNLSDTETKKGNIDNGSNKSQYILINVIYNVLSIVLRIFEKLYISLKRIFEKKVLE